MDLQALILAGADVTDTQKTRVKGHGCPVGSGITDTRNRHYRKKSGRGSAPGKGVLLSPTRKGDGDSWEGVRADGRGNGNDVTRLRRHAGPSLYTWEVSEP